MLMTLALASGVVAGSVPAGAHGRLELLSVSSAPQWQPSYLEPTSVYTTAMNMLQIRLLPGTNMPGMGTVSEIKL